MNRMWRVGKGHTYLSADSRAYKDAVGMLTAKYRSKNQCAFPSGDLSIVVIWHRSARRGDLDNRLKVLFDALRGTVFRDDKQIAHIDATRCDSHPSVPKGFMGVWIGLRGAQGP